MPLRAVLILIALAATAALVAVFASLAGVAWYMGRRGFWEYDPLLLIIPLSIIILMILRLRHVWAVGLLLIFTAMLTFDMCTDFLFHDFWIWSQALFCLLLALTAGYAWHLRYYMDD